MMKPGFFGLMDVPSWCLTALYWTTSMYIVYTIEKYNFSYRFLSYLASKWAKIASDIAGCDDKRTILAVEIAERWGLGEDFDQSYLSTVASDVRSAIGYGFYDAPFPAAAYYAVVHLHQAAFGIFDIVDGKGYYLSSIAASNRVIKDDSGELFKPLLIQCIRDRMSKLEQVLVLGDDIDIISKSW